MKIVFFSAHDYEKTFFSEVNTQYNNKITFFEVPLDVHSAGLAKGFDAVCVFVNDVLNKAVLDILSAEGIKVIALRCAGYNNVDIKYADQLNIPVVRVPKYSPHAVAEHALALIMGLNRKIHRAYNRVREGNFALNTLMGFDLYQKTVGVIGTGEIGSVFCKIMKGLGTRVIAYDVMHNRALEDEIQYVDIEEIFRTSDIISLHVPLNPKTYHLIDRQAISRMKDGVMLINTSRGGLINAPAVINALKNGKIGSLGIDVYEQEADLFFQDLSDKIIQDDVFMRLTTFPNVLITAHQAFFTQEAMEQIVKTTFQNLHEFENGAGLTNQITLDMIQSN